MLNIWDNLTIFTKISIVDFMKKCEILLKKIREIMGEKLSSTCALSSERAKYFS